MTPPATAEIDPHGISRIERFLDDIEDGDEETLQNFQSKFDEILKNYENIDAFGSTEFYDNKSKSECWKEELRNGKDVVKHGTKSYDGFEECVYKGKVDNHDLPIGEGHLLYSTTESFSGTFYLSVKNRVGVRMFSGGDIAKIEGTWTHGFLEGRARTEFATGGYREGFYQCGVLHGFAREFGIGGYLKEFRYRHFTLYDK